MLTKFHLSYFLTRLVLASLSALGITIFFKVFILDERVEESFVQVDVSTRDPVLAERGVREYWKTHYDPNLIMRHKKVYRGGRLISETKHYMDGRVVTEGMEQDHILIYAGTIILFMIMFLLIPMFYSKPQQSELKPSVT